MEQRENKNGPGIGPRYAIRLADLRDWHVIGVICEGCRHRARVPPKLLTAGRPGHTRLIDLERKLVCSACGNRHGNRLSVTMMDRG